MKILDKINKDLDKLSNAWAHGNAHGIPVTEGGSLTLTSTRFLAFKENIELRPETPEILREIANILEKHY